jgi:Fe-S cluster assembly iron-binding protein IscA
MNINITDEAKTKLKDLMSHSRYNNPVLRLLIAGYG